MVSEFKDRYSRNFNTLSENDQKQLGNSKVVVLGLGGLGGSVCEMLARIGVGQLTVVDGDTFEASNLNRQLFCQEKLLGVSKAQAAVERIHAINSEILVTSVHKYLDESNFETWIEMADLVVDCLDSIDTRFKLQEAAFNVKIPIVSGAIAGVAGQVMTILPGDKGYELVYGKKENTQTRGVETKTGNISYCALFVASLQSSECIKVLLKRGDILQNKLLIADLWTNRFDVLDLI